MHKRNLILLGLVVVVAAQLAVPAWMIIDRELTLREGFVFKFKTRPVDPVDAFRGRYVWLNLEPGVVKVTDVKQWGYNQKAFAVLGTDSNGFATVEQLERVAPDGKAAVPVRVSYPGVKDGQVQINWMGLDRFYMTEQKAPAAEAAYREHSRRTNQTCHVTVRVRGRRAVLENLFVEDQPIHDWLKTHAPIK
ncbi:MAG: GDYXXLXY domain-containing protein [bacterium]